MHLDDETTSPSSSGASTSGSSSGSSTSSSTQKPRDPAALRAAYDAGRARLHHLVDLLKSPPPPLSQGVVDLSLDKMPASPGRSNMTEGSFLGAIAAAKEYILVGLVFIFGGRGWGGWGGGAVARLGCYVVRLLC